MSIKEIIEILPRSYRRSAAGVTFSVLLRAIFNFAGLAVLIPMFILMFNANEIGGSSILGKIHSWTHITDENAFIIMVCIAIVVFIILKNVVNELLGTFQIRYVNSLYRYYSAKLFESYYKRGLLYIKNVNTNSLAHKINGVCFTLSQNVLSLSFTMLGEAILLLFIWIGLALYFFKIALFTVFCLLPVIWLYFFIVRRELEKNGRAENEVRRKQARIVSETFKGYVEMEVNNAYPFFKRQFDEGLAGISYYRERVDRVLRIPSEMVEVGIIIVMVLLVLISKGNNEIKVAFGVFAVTIVRMLPAVRTLMSGWAQLKNNAYTLDIVKEVIEFEKKEKEDKEIPADPVSFQRQIVFDKVDFYFPDSTQPEKPVIENFSMAISKGEKIGICGISGVGKTTLFNLLLGFYTPQSGSVSVDGKPLNGINRTSWHDIIGYVPQDVFIMDGTLAENVAIGESSESIDRNRLMKSLEQANLRTFVDSLSEGIETHIGESGSRLSGGQRQRVGIARTLYKQAEILLLDEATSSLDFATECEIIKTISELSDSNKKLTILMISHRESSLSFCDRIIRL